MVARHFQVPAHGEESSSRHHLGEYDAAVLCRIALGRLQAERTWPRIEPAWCGRVSRDQASSYQSQRATHRMVLRAKPRFAVLGGAGAIGRIVVRDLFESSPKNEILVSDHDERAASNVAKSYRSRRVSAA